MEPSEKLPCTFAVPRALGFASFKTEIIPGTATKPIKIEDLAKLSINDIKFLPRRGANPSVISASITNKSPFTARHVWALVTLYSADHKIVTVAEAQVGTGELAPGQSETFTADVDEAAEKPEDYRIKAIGYED
jgi:hypothetical protein